MGAALDGETFTVQAVTMESRDVIARCVVADNAARVVVVIATEFAREAARRHQARGAAAVAMARTGIAGLLLATLTKDEERVTLQLLGDGALGGLTADASSAGTARVFVSNPRVAYLESDAVRARRPSLGTAVGLTGIVTVIRDLGMGDRYRGQTHFVDGEIDTDVERYLNDSEQIDSALGCEAFLDPAGGIAFATGILVQSLPGGSGGNVVAAARARLRGGDLALALTRRIAADEGAASAITTAEVAGAALGEDVASLVQLGELRPVRFHCPCSRERAAATLAMLGESELVSMIEQDGGGEVTCEFCRNKYQFTDENLEAIRHGLQSRVNAPPLPS